jgi:hypothetical protein
MGRTLQQAKRSSKAFAGAGSVRPVWERAKFELILCAAAPAEWQIALSGVLALALSIGLGALLASRWQRTS